MKQVVRKFIVSLVVLLSCNLTVTFVYAQQGAGNKTRSQGGKKVTNINFEDQLIHGDIEKPELFYILQKKQFNFSKLIKMRENFLPEMKKTSEEIPRGIK